MKPVELKTSMQMDFIPFCGEGAVENAFVFLHGFPGLYTRNEDLAGFCAASLNGDAYIPHYSGIGRSEGEFLFTDAIKHCISMVEQLATSGRYKRINLVGHSFGGFVALSMLRLANCRFNRTLLLSPFTLLPDASTLRPDLENFVSQQKLTGKIADVERLLKDVADAQMEFFPKLLHGLTKQEKGSVLVLQAINDTVMPREVNQTRFKELLDIVSYRELDDNHWFTTRAAVFGAALEFFKGK